MSGAGATQIEIGLGTYTELVKNPIRSVMARILVLQKLTSPGGRPVDSIVTSGSLYADIVHQGKDQTQCACAYVHISIFVCR